MTKKKAAAKRKIRIPAKVEVGQLYKVHSPFLANDKRIHGRKSKIEMLPGDVLEIRYAYAWHFRFILDGGPVYLQCSEECLLSNCDIFGIIHPDVRFENKCGIKEILEKNYYTTINDLLFSVGGIDNPSQ